MERPQPHAGCAGAPVVVFPDEAVRIAQTLAVPMTACVETAPAADVAPDAPEAGAAAFRLGRDAAPRVLILSKHRDGATPACRFAVATTGPSLCGLAMLAPAACTGHPRADGGRWAAVREAWHREIDRDPWTMPFEVFADHLIWAFTAGDNHG